MLKKSPQYYFLSIAALLLLVSCTLITSVFAANSLTTRLKGRLLLQVEDRGRIWYVDPVGLQKHEITFANALSLFQNLSLGITNSDLNHIPINPESVSDQLDTDHDGYTDKTEVKNGYHPEIASNPVNRGNDKVLPYPALMNRLKGRLLLQVEDRGRIWYVDMDGTRWEVTWGNLINLFRKLALGISNKDLAEVGASATNDCGSDNEFVSQELGISFCYPDKYGAHDVAVKQKDQKVYVYWANESFEQGQSVEVFEKNETDTLKMAIEKQFQLNNYQDCSVDESTLKHNTDGSITVGALGFPWDWESNGPPSNNDQCPIGYGKTNGIRYFYTTANADKFLFFDIGQYGINLSDGRFWQDTIKFIDPTPID